MKLFQQLLVAPAALGLMAPLAANAAELNINGVSGYSDSMEQVESISDFSDVYPTDWAFQALTDLAERHGCVAASPSGSMTRYEAAALLNKCLGNVAQANEEERRLLNEFASELAVIQGRLDGLDAGLGEFEAGQFSTTTKIGGETIFVVGGVEKSTNSNEEATTFSYKTAFEIETSFSGDDLLVTEIETGNFSSSGPFASGNTVLETANTGGNALEVGKLYYTFPVGDDFKAFVGPNVRQDDMLAVWPSSYPSDTVLDSLTYAGATAAYSLANGAGFGLNYFKDNISASLVLVSDEATDADATSGGILTTAGSDDVTAQIAWSSEGLTVAGVYTISDGGVENDTASADRYDAYGISVDWILDNESEFFPSSVSAGMGWKSVDKESDASDIEDETTWTVGLLWEDMFSEGNTLGIGVGTAEGHRDDDGYDDPLAYELFYSIAVSDNITVTPAVFIVENDSDSEYDYTGALVKTTFSF